SSNFRIAKFEIVVDAQYLGFEKYSLKDFKFVPVYLGKMIFDIALDARNPEPCGYGGADCLESPVVKEKEGKFQANVSQRSLEKLPKRENKTRFCGTITDEQGAVILNASIEGKSSKENNFKINTDSSGSFDTEIFAGLYKILIKADGFKKVVMKNKLLLSESKMCIQIELKSNVLPHQIT
ncbi:MAG: carboxypeptidase-like regulatory domain-containing protein, partial [Acidobacteriota bacterium]|nr:carboxypeptidase-like regulatory domain-containing protein [Acidobacteriota bacterium]